VYTTRTKGTVIGCKGCLAGLRNSKRDGDGGDRWNIRDVDIEKEMKYKEITSQLS
jgi:hypothetical protein